MQHQVSNPVCVITGGAGGIGYHLCKGFQQAGYRTISLDQHNNHPHHDQIEWMQTDVGDAIQIEQAFLQIAEKHGAIHVLVNNAAIAHFHRPIEQTTAEEFDRMIQVNLRGSYLCAKAFVKYNQGQPYGRIIQIASTRWHQNEAHWELYGATKGGLISLTRSLCVSLSSTPITVNTISPGWIECTQYEQLKPIHHQQHPSGRVGKPDDIVRAALFLAQPDNDFVNGINLVVDGGMTNRMIYFD